MQTPLNNQVSVPRGKQALDAMQLLLSLGPDLVMLLAGYEFPWD